MKKHSFQGFRYLWAAFGAALGACGGDDGAMMNPLGASGVSGGFAAAGVGAAGIVAPGPAGTGASGSPTVGVAGTGVAGTFGAAGSTAAGSGAAGMIGAAGSMVPVAGSTGAAGMGAAGSTAGMTGSMAGMGASGRGAAGAAAGSSGGGAAGGGAGGAPATGASFTQVYGLIMTGCSCHVSSAPGGLGMMSKSSAYTNLVGAASTSCANQKRVVANDPANSVLLHSIDRTSLGSCRVPAMPQGGAKWSQANIDTVKSWIMAGAPNN